MAAVTIKVKMASTGLNAKGKPTGHFYTTKKNPRNHPEKMKLMKYDPIARKHVIYEEKKVK